MPTGWEDITPFEDEYTDDWGGITPEYRTTPTTVNTYVPSLWDTVEPQQPQPSIAKRGASFVQDLMGVEPTTPQQDRQTTMDIFGGQRAAEPTVFEGAQEPVTATGRALEQAGANFLVGAFPGLKSVFEQVDGERFVRDPDGLVEELAAGAGRFAGIITGLPGKAAHAATGAVLKQFPKLQAFANTPAFSRILKSVATEGLSVGTMSALGGLDAALEQESVEDAIKVMGESLVEGAKLGGVFGAARGVFPDKNIMSRIGRIASGMVGLELLHGDQPPANKEEKIMNIVHKMMDVYFLWNGLGRDLGVKSLKELEAEKNPTKKYNMLKEIEIYNLKRDYNKLPPRAKVASARDMLDQIEEFHSRVPEGAASPWSHELAQKLDSEPLLLPAGQGFEMSDVPVRDIRTMLDTGQLMLPEPPAERMAEMTAGEQPGQIVEASRWSPELAEQLQVLSLPDAPHGDLTAARQGVEGTLRRMSDAAQRMTEYADSMGEGKARDAILKRVKEYEKRIEELGGELADIQLQREAREFTMGEPVPETKLRKGQPEGQAVRDKDVPAPEVVDKEGKPVKPAKEEAPVVDTTEARKTGEAVSKAVAESIPGVTYDGVQPGIGKITDKYSFTDKETGSTFLVEEPTATNIMDALSAKRATGAKPAKKKVERKEKPKKRKVGEPKPKKEEPKKTKQEPKKPAPKPTKKEKPKEAEDAPQVAEGTKKFVDRRVRELGSVEAVDAVYTTGDELSKYARAKAREMFPKKDKIPKQEKPKKEEKISPEETVSPVGEKIKVGEKVMTPDGEGVVETVKAKHLRADQVEVKVDGGVEVYGTDELGERKPAGKAKKVSKPEPKPKKKISREESLATKNAKKVGIKYLGKEGESYAFEDASGNRLTTKTPKIDDLRGAVDAATYKEVKAKAEKVEKKTKAAKEKAKTDDIVEEAKESRRKLDKKVKESKKKTDKEIAELKPEPGDEPVPVTEEDAYEHGRNLGKLARRMEELEDRVAQRRAEFGTARDLTEAQGAEMARLTNELMALQLEYAKASEGPTETPKETKEREKRERKAEETVDYKRLNLQQAWRAAEDLAISKGMASRTVSGHIRPRVGHTQKEVDLFVQRARDQILAEQQAQPEKVSDKIGKRVEFNYPQSEKYEHLAGQVGQGEIIKETAASYKVMTDDGVELLLKKKNVTIEPEARKGGAQKVRDMTDEALSAEAEKIGKMVEAGEYVDPDYGKAVGMEVMRRIEEQKSKKRAKKDAIMEVRKEELAQKNARKRFGKRTKESIGTNTMSFMGTGSVWPGMKAAYRSMKKTFKKLNETRKSLIDTFNEKPLPANYFNLKKEMITKRDRMVEHELQFMMDTKRAIRDAATSKEDAKLLGDAMSLWIEYKTRPDLVDKYYDKVDAHTQKIIDRMRQMNDKEMDLARTLEMHITENGIVGEHGGVLTRLKDNPLSGFISHIWQSPVVQGHGMTRTFWNKGTGKISPKTQFGKERTYREGFLEGIADGFKPATMNVAELTRAYGESVWKAVTNKRFIDDLRESSVNTDNRPAMVGAFEKGYEDYVHIDNYWLTKKKFTGLKDLSETLSRKTYTGEEMNRFLMEYTPVKVHPDIAGDLNRYLEPSWFVKSKYGRLAKKANYLAKKSLLSFTGFHHVAIGKTALFYMDGKHVVDALVRPWKISKDGLDLISKQDADIDLLMREGLTLSMGGAQDYGRQLSSAIRDWDTYMRDSGVAKKAYGNVRKFSKWWDQGLWDKWYRGSKALAGKIEYNRRLKKFEKEITSGKISRQEIARRVARDMNNNFGGLNMDFGTGWMGETHGRSRSKTAQDFTRFMLLAQDWTESNWKFFWQATGGSAVKHGIPGTKGFNLKELYFGDSTKYMMKVLFFTGLATNMINYAINGDHAFNNDQKDPNSPSNFRVKVPIGDKTFYIDLFGHFMEPVKLAMETLEKSGNPLEKIAHKSSIPLRVLIEQVTGRDWAGRHFATWDEVSKGKIVGSRYGASPGMKETLPGRAIDLTRKVVPIPLNAVLGIPLDDKTILEAITTGVGIPMREKRYKGKSVRTTKRRRKARPRRRIKRRPRRRIQRS